MTYNVFGGTLSLTQSINHYANKEIFFVQDSVRIIDKDRIMGIVWEVYLGLTWLGT